MRDVEGGPRGVERARAEHLLLGQVVALIDGVRARRRHLHADGQLRKQTVAGEPVLLCVGFPRDGHVRMALRQSERAHGLRTRRGRLAGGAARVLAVALAVLLSSVIW